MTNIQIPIGGAPVNVPMTTPGNGPGGTFINSGFQMVSTTGATLVPATPYPASGASVTIANLVFTNTGQTDTIASIAYPRLSVQALAAATAAVGNALEEGQGTNLNVFALFDVVAAPIPAPGAPTGPAATYAAGVVTIAATARPAGENVTAYNCYRSQNGGPVTKIGTAATPAFTDPTPLTNVAYTNSYFITAVNATSEGAPSATVNVAIPRNPAATETASVFRGTQLIMEAVPGTTPQGATPKRLTQSQLIVVPKPTPKPYKPMGMKGISVVQQGSETTDAKLTGVLSYTELPYQLESALKKSAAPVQVGALAYTRVYNVQARNPEAMPQTYTVETGSTQGADRFAFGFFKGLAIKTTKKDATVDGDMVGWPLQDNVTLTPGATDVPKVPIDPSTIGIYIGDDPANLSRLVTPLDTTLNLLAHWQEQEYQNDTNNSFDGVVEMAPNFGFKITVVAGSQAFLMLSRLRNGQSIYAGMRARGPVIETAVGGAVVSQYGFDAILPCKVISTPGRQDSQGAWTHQYEFALADDSVFGAGKITITNTLATL